MAAKLPAHDQISVSAESARELPMAASADAPADLSASAAAAKGEILDFQSG
jgi:hypothetical protein